MFNMCARKEDWSKILQKGDLGNPHISYVFEEGVKLELNVCQGPSKGSLSNSIIWITKVYCPISKTQSKPRKLTGDVNGQIGALSKSSNNVVSLCMPFCPRNSRVIKLAHTQR